MEIPSRVLPEFNKKKCNTYFKKACAAVNPTKLFVIPDWIPKFSEPSVDFNLSPPTYNKICKIIKRMKAWVHPVHSTKFPSYVSRDAQFFEALCSKFVKRFETKINRELSQTLSTTETDSCCQ